MPISALAYRTALRVLRLASPWVFPGDSKLARGLRGRRGAAGRLSEWGLEHRDPDRPLLWIHAPSVGEGLQARAVFEAVRRRAPDLQSVFTHFSPSAESLAGQIGTNASDYLPWDLEAEVGRVLDALQPDLVAFTKTEVWPTLAREADRRAVPMALIAATLPEGSSRLSPIARRLLSPTFTRLSAVHAVSEADGARFARLGVAASTVVVTGDPGVDSAAERVGGADRTALPLVAFGEDRPRIIAGSTWPADEDVLLPASRRIRDAVASVQLVIAPHEPTPTVVAALLGRLEGDGWRAAALAEVEAAGSAESWNAVVIDRVGVLAHLYTVGSVGYVGGGFHGQGLHSVLEPAAAGIPVCFGPRHLNALAAADLLEIRGAREVADVDALVGVLGTWLADGAARGAAGAAASRYIDAHRGAADRSASLLLERMRA